MPKRGPAEPGRQLGAVQRRILVWVFVLTGQLELDLAGEAYDPACQWHVDQFKRLLKPVVFSDGTEITDLKKVLDYKGLPITAKLFYNKLPTNSEKSTLSRNLPLLESKGLLELCDSSLATALVPQTTNIRLTVFGEEVAQSLYANKLKSKRGLKAGRRGKTLVSVYV